MKSFFRILLGLVLLGIAQIALADDVGAIKVVINSIFDTTKGLAANSPFLEDGKHLYALILLILISWTGVQMMFDDGGMPKAMAGILKIILTAGIATFFLSAETQTQLIKGFDYCAAKAVKATGANLSIEDPAAGIMSIMATGLQSAANMWSGPDTKGDANDKVQDNEKKRSWLQDLVSAVSLDNVVGALSETLAKIGITLLLLVAIALFSIQLLMSQVLVNIGLILAPLFIPWLLWESSSFLFHGWLKFMIVTGVQKIVGALLFGLSIKLIDAVGALSVTADSASTFDFFAYSTALMLVLMMVALIWQVPSIASGLVSGMPATSVSFRSLSPQRSSSAGGRGSSANPPSMPPSGGGGPR